MGCWAKSYVQVEHAIISNKPLNFGDDAWPVCLSVSILLENL